MGVTGEIAQHLLGPCERRLAIDNPLDAPQRGDETLERPFVGEPGVGVEECQLVGVMRLHEHGQHLAAERRASTLTWTRKLAREATHRALSNEIPPPGTIMCTCG